MRATSTDVLLLVDKPARSQNEIYIGKAVPPPTSEQWPALEVAITLLGGNFSARLTRELRSKRGWTYGVEARRLRNHEASLFYVWTFTAPDRALDSIELVLAELELLASNGPTPAEFERARGYTKGRLILSTDTPATLAREAGRSARFGLGPHAIERRMRELDELQGEDVVRVFAGLLAPHDLGIVMVCSAEHFGEAMGRLNGVVEVATEAYDAD